MNKTTNMFAAMGKIALGIVAIGSVAYLATRPENKSKLKVLAGSVKDKLGSVASTIRESLPAAVLASKANGADHGSARLDA